jgi:hypothetical protein
MFLIFSFCSSNLIEIKYKQIPQITKQTPKQRKREEEEPNIILYNKLNIILRRKRIM